MTVQREDIPDFQTIMLPMLQLLANGKQWTLNEVMKALTKYFNLTEEHIKNSKSWKTNGLYSWGKTPVFYKDVISVLS